ncbi:hypothetical protein M2323_004665 [Rhodoblastus acidophilus]|uniref:hypothetical protein n=1 Tax=Rhodoblastus acidophilus TaxID=1074 RepID=UPI0022243BC2|nr:hypothetical protein [Rhodoblastus acidophilus]MCW2286857.1 hypothetical protein [Rhodoblastus acidophilus]MCW2335709.1 hypothetical protein [Rhodoblastus acidophilus]
MKYITKGTVASVLSIVSLGVSISGNHELATWLGSQDTATNVFALLSAFLALYAGAAQGIKSVHATPSQEH